MHETHRSCFMHWRYCSSTSFSSFGGPGPVHNPALGKMGECLSQIYKFHSFKTLTRNIVTRTNKQVHRKLSLSRANLTSHPQADVQSEWKLTYRPFTNHSAALIFRLEYDFRSAPLRVPSNPRYEWASPSQSCHHSMCDARTRGFARR